jgi:Flp pilus assembly protein TadG
MARRRGNSTLTTVLVLPVLLFVVLGVVEFGQFFYIRAAFAAAARDVARASCLQTAVQTDPVTRATATLAQANVTFNPSWMTIVDATNSNAVVTDVTAVPYGDQIVVTITTPYGSIPNAYRPLYAFTGHGIGSGKVCAGVCRMIRE